MSGGCHGLKTTFQCLVEVLPFFRKDLKRLHRFAGLTWRIVCCEAYFRVVLSQLGELARRPGLTRLSSRTLSRGLWTRSLPRAHRSAKGHPSHHGESWDELREAPSGFPWSFHLRFRFLVITNGWKVPHVSTCVGFA